MQVKYDFKQNIFLWYKFNYNSTLLEINAQSGLISKLLCSKVKKIVCCDVDNKFEGNFKNIVGYKESFTSIDFDGKFDYIIINNLDRYINCKKIDIRELFFKIENLLSDKGIILFTIKNKYAFKNFCGDLQEENVLYKNMDYAIYNKHELERIFKEFKFNYKFYYPFPNSNLTEILLTDEFLDKKVFVNYQPIHYNNKNLFIDELRFYKMSFYDNSLPFFSNDFLIELSHNDIKTNVSFIKYNNYRKLKYNLYTYCKENKYYKSNISKIGEKFLNEYANSCNEMKKIGIKSIEIKNDSEGFYTDEIFNDSLLNKIIKEYEKDGEIAIERNLIIYNEYLKKHFTNSKYIDNSTIFKKYDIDVPNEIIGKLHFLGNAYIDIIPQNMMIIDNDFYLIDQEWKMENVPYEYVLYRGIISVLSHFDDIEFRMKKYFDLFSISEYFTIFFLLEEKFYNNLESQKYKDIKKYHKYKLVNTEDFMKIEKIYDYVQKQHSDEINKLKFDKQSIENENQNLIKELSEIKNSTSWKLTEPMRKFMDKIRSIKRKK